MRSDLVKKWGPNGTSWLLLAAFSLSILCFLVATYASNRAERAIGAAANEIATIATPAGSRIHAIRSNVRRIDVALALALGFPEKMTPTRVERYEELIAQTEHDLSDYMNSPAFPAEEPLRPAIRDRWGDVQSALQRVRLAAVSGSREVAFQTMIGIFRPAVDGLEEVLTLCQETNAHEATTRAALIDVHWQHARTVGTTLTTLSVVLTLLTAVLAIATVRRQTQQLMRQAEESVQFAGRVAHDVLSPVSPIRIFLDLAHSKGLDHPIVARALPKARSALDRLVNVVDALLAFAKAGAQAPDHAMCRVDDVVRGVVEDQRDEAKRQGIELQIQSAADVYARCEPGVLSSVLSNLLRNAIKYMGDAPLRLVEVRVQHEKVGVRFEVKDSGPGIAPEWQKRIFKPLTRLPSASGQGIGLGLATVHRLVLAHGGQVGLDSAPGDGSRFWFVLPVASVEEYPLATA
jgi:signal transduction histidine kinase